MHVATGLVRCPGSSLSLCLFTEGGREALHLFSRVGQPETQLFFRSSIVGFRMRPSSNFMSIRNTSRVPHLTLVGCWRRLEHEFLNFKEISSNGLYQPWSISIWHADLSHTTTYGGRVHALRLTPVMRPKMRRRGDYS